MTGRQTNQHMSWPQQREHDLAMMKLRQRNARFTALKTFLGDLIGVVSLGVILVVFLVFTI